MKSLIILCFANFICINAQQAPSEKFFNELKKHCGKTYEGKIMAGGKEGDGFTGNRLVMFVNSCKENEIQIPFNVGENRSRTWILKMDEKKYIQLKHDHRHEDGTNDKVTMYGGKATNKGFENLQIFPADEETANLISYASGNVWWISIDKTTFTYNLRRIGTDRYFSVSFDLTKEVEKPEKSWGW